jgi:uncharacterized ferritin-like protein (DUF455 family)
MPRPMLNDTEKPDPILPAERFARQVLPDVKVKTMHEELAVAVTTLRDAMITRMSELVDCGDIETKISKAREIGRLGAAIWALLDTNDTYGLLRPDRLPSLIATKERSAPPADAEAALSRLGVWAVRENVGPLIVRHASAHALFVGDRAVPRGGALLPAARTGRLQVVQPPKSNGNIGRLPDRPSYLTYAAAPSRSFASLTGSHEGRGQLVVSMMLDIEISACEICSLMALSYPALGLEFLLDMAQQIQDEGYHASRMLSHYRAMGFSLGDHPEYTAHAFRKWKVARDLPERLAIQNVLQEGNALDNISVLAGVFRRHGELAFSDILDDIEPDETYHCYLGIKWLERLGYDQPDRLIGLMDAVATKIGAAFPGAFPVNERGRLAAGFDMSVVATLLKRQS